MLDSVRRGLDAWSGGVQAATAVVVALWLFWTYRGFVPGLYRFAARFPGLAAVLAALYLMIYGLLGSSFGLDYLFWHDDFLIRSFSSAGATLLLAVVGMIAFYLDPHPWATAVKTAEFLRPEEEIRRRIATWYRRRLPGEARAGSGAGAHAATLSVVPRRRDHARFALNALIDPVALTPLQSWLDVGPGNTHRLQSFLRAARGPFLLLLLAPAVLPAAFPAVPHAAPTGMLGPFYGTGYEPPNLDVTRSIKGYLIGLAAWLLGIQAGVLIIKGFLRCARPIHDTHLTERLVALGDRVGRLLGPAAGRLRGAYTRSGASERLRRGAERIRGAGARSSGALEDATAVIARAHAHCPLARTGACPGDGCPWGEPSARPPHPEGCRARDEVCAAALVFAILFFGSFVVLGAVRWLREVHFLPDLVLGYPLLDIPPAFAICLILAVLAMGYAMIASLTRYRRVAVVLALVAWFGVANMGAFKNRFEKLSYEKIEPLRDRLIDAYDTPPGERDETRQPAPDRTPLISDSDALRRWKQGALADPERPDVDPRGRPKLVLVAASGGATRSAYWTAVVLDRLEKELGPSFGHRVRIVCGASGGMLGAACYVDYRRAVAQKPEAAGPFGDERPTLAGWRAAERGVADDPALGPAPAAQLPFWIREGLPKRSLEPLARGIALAEIWKSAWPGTVFKDRGVVLERDWGWLRYPIHSLAPLEAEGKIPSLIFSPMIVEDGRRLLISNLELGRDGRGEAGSPLVQAAGRPINLDEFRPDVANDGTEHRRYSLSGLEYFRLLPTAAHRDLLLSTAVRMSASFPFVSPAVNLPTDPPRRVVDAGYYDNYGVQVATSWIRRNRPWLYENTSGVLLVQIRDSSSIASRFGVEDARPGWLATFARGFQFLTSPIDAFAKAREATAMFRNDADVASLDSFGWKTANENFVDPPTHPESFFTTVIFENSAEVTIDPEDFWEELTNLWNRRPARRDFREVAMSWYLTRAEMDATVAAIPGDPIGPKSRHPGHPGDSNPDWRDPEERRAMMAWLNGRINARDHTGTAPGGPVAPDPERALCQKRMDQLANYERLLNLKKWWRRPAR